MKNSASVNISMCQLSCIERRFPHCWKTSRQKLPVTWRLTDSSQTAARLLRDNKPSCCKKISQHMLNIRAQPARLHPSVQWFCATIHYTASTWSLEQSWHYCLQSTLHDIKRSCHDSLPLRNLSGSYGLFKCSIHNSRPCWFSTIMMCEVLMYNCVTWSI